ncbi:uncharacterized protein LOC124945651 [Impatiens glandulifera]|uniref:uncharacterized protein LOC124945651 n=1 Tax=Impatiens glandulifera TaxID=253017 RepID=UPI001FB088CA|nr:uncharacterized protein LOC124945651 [Impatiens glandulifera]
MSRIRSRDVNVQYDEYLDRHLKRRKIHTGDFAYNLDIIMQNKGNTDGKIDEAYLNYLAHVRNDGERQKGIYESEDEDEDEVETDPQYIKFLQCLKKDGKSYILTTIGEDGKPLHIKYEKEEDDELNEDHVPQKPRKTISKDVRAPNRIINEDNGEMGRKCRGKAVETSTLGGTKDLEREFRDHGEPNRCASHRKSARIDKTPAAGGKDMKIFKTDPNYQIFLDNIKREQPLFVRIGDIAITYSEDESPADSEILVTTDVSDFNVGNHNPFVTSKHFITSPVENMEQPSTMNCSQFKERLMSVLKTPFNEIEYKRLKEEIKKQTPKNGRHRDLRGDASLRSYPTDECNESYLEQHTDFKLKMCEAKMDEPKQLNLLRGFFFWLENLAHDGAFHPWKDPHCV